MGNKTKAKSVTIESNFKESEILEIKNQLLSELKKFDFSKAIYIKPRARHGKTYVKLLQDNICDYLKESVPNFEWQTEYCKPGSNCKDRVDIFGESLNNNVKIIVELDARVDQLAKKFLSRQALFINENVIYVTLRYPSTEKNPNECLKYFKYCKTLSDFISSNTSVPKLFIGHILEPIKEINHEKFI